MTLTLELGRAAVGIHAKTSLASPYGGAGGLGGVISALLEAE